MNLQKAFKEFPEECKLVIEASGNWKLSENNNKYQKLKTRRYLNEEDLGWLTFCWIIQNLDNLDMSTIDLQSDDILKILLQIIAKNTRKPKKRTYRRRKRQ
jgi:hypothetical protein